TREPTRQAATRFWPARRCKHRALLTYLREKRPSVNSRKPYDEPEGVTLARQGNRSDVRLRRRGLPRRSSLAVHDTRAKAGGMAEWSMAVVLKTTVPGRAPGVRTPFPPRLVASSCRR